MEKKQKSLSQILFSWRQNNNDNNTSNGSRNSYPKIKNSKSKMDVVDSLFIMRQGSLMIISSPNEIHNNIEYNTCYLSTDNQFIQIGPKKQTILSIKDIANISPLEDDLLRQIECTLNIKGVTTIGLRSLMFLIDFKGREEIKRLYFIGDSHRVSYIWLQGLQGLHTNSNPSSITSLPLIVSNNLRIGMKNLHSFPNNPFSIEPEYSLLSKHINDLYSFASNACILDSTEHLTLLSQATNLKTMNNELEKYLQKLKNKNNNNIDNNNNNNNNNNNINNDDVDMAKIEELYYCLHSECTVVSLKSRSMQHDMELSRVP